ncbi:DNA-directed RNA polymerase subunit beta [Paenibacillus motobuensis]|uniref:DNA-directed RNA polymerase subunit beta n=1 Tax=Paenibacillus TaxID=44249 RepID=UPI00203A5535|nr:MULTISPECIES: DNA-directed RNA polymerase subunit beta [Paenibacillus]MCM3040967.1 DNA-directed RNA polymerase subunit beta [Paenibacillus lutimineralis]MCM3648071.1 DNA-directed RNA polymerase subunit beta [Paenibacillus motobuensis]
MTEKNNPEVKHRAWWIVPLRIVLILLFFAAALIGGAIAGYVVLGKQDIHDVLDWSTWRHVFDLVFAP